MFGIDDHEIKRLISAIDYAEALTITAAKDDVVKSCEDAKRYGFRAVVAFPQYLGLLVDALVRYQGACTDSSRFPMWWGNHICQVQGS